MNWDNGETMDSDAFLSQIESKLRGPFTSIDFAKAVSSATAASNEYLSSVLSVLPLAEKITQLRILIGNLGLEPSTVNDDEIKNILTTTQQAPLYEEWVRVISGIVEDILFRSVSFSFNTNENEAKLLLDKTSSEIIHRLKDLEKSTACTDEEARHPLAQIDASPIFVPYRHNVLSPSLLQTIIPDSKAHSHFRINSNSDILHMDLDMEIEKLKEEQDHHVAISTCLTLAPSAIRKQPVTTSQLLENNERKAANVRVKSSSMFIPSKSRSVAGRVATGTGAVVKQQLHHRKAGAAQALLAKGRRGRLMQPSAAAGNLVTASAQIAVQRQLNERTAVKLTSAPRGSHKSKMKMIDVTEVQGLESKKQQDFGKMPTPQKSLRTHAVSGRKRPHDELKKEHVTASKGRKNDKSKSAATTETPILEKEIPLLVKTESNVSPVETGNAGELASAALLAYQSRTVQSTAKSTTLATEFNDPSTNMTKQQDWRELLQVRSNRLTEADRQRIQQFFVDRFNPTPTQRNYKMKLHEERTCDAMTGKTMKETYYLELDYETFTSTQTKKIKRYDGN
jgi:hypothetical protein